MSCSSGSHVAATIRTSTATGSSLPTGLTQPSSTARSSRAWTPRGSAATSSMNRVPPRACRKAPARSLWAPVKAPRRWPNSSEPDSSSESVAPLSATNGPATRGLAQWTARATSSLPEPDSPSSSTGARSAAIRRTSRLSCCMAGDRPTMPGNGSKRPSPSLPPRPAPRLSAAARSAASEWHPHRPSTSRSQATMCALLRRCLRSSERRHAAAPSCALCAGSLPLRGRVAVRTARFPFARSAARA